MPFTFRFLNTKQQLRKKFTNRPQNGLQNIQFQHPQRKIRSIQRDRRCILVDIFGVILKLIFIFSRKRWNSFSISLGPISIYICTKLLIINANFQPSRNLFVTLDLYARNWFEWSYLQRKANKQFKNESQSLILGHIFAGNSIVKLIVELGS